MEKGNIKPINFNSVHKICSGQVVLTLTTAVKELVENSIDAGATIIEVKLKEYGSEMIEVIDNGKGVKSSDFQSITLKHHTSKIEDFSDVQFVSTFGFRGEALSSLCALSNVEIITNHCDSPVGYQLIYDHDGVLVKKIPTHRQIGTTVVLKNLFFTLPVRHKEFHRNLRREYVKMLQVLTAYCLISTNRRITCTNISEKGKKTVALSTNSCATFKDNILTLFGKKQVDNLMQFVQLSPAETVLEEYFLTASAIEKSGAFKLEGYISNSNHGEGRSSTDRQFFFINGRPCDLPKISRLINEVYHSFNKSQYPFVFLNINLTEGAADVNVTPDKREIFLPDEKVLLCIIKTSLLHMYKLQPSVMNLATVNPMFQRSISDMSSFSNTPVNKKEEYLLKRKLDSNNYCDQNSSPLKSLKKDNSNNEGKGEVPSNSEDSPDSGCGLSGEIASPQPIKQSECGSLSETNIKQQTPTINDINFTLTLPYVEDKVLRNASQFKNEKLNFKEALQKAYRGNNSPFPNLSKTKTSNCQKSAAINDTIKNYIFKSSFKEKIPNLDTDTSRKDSVMFCIKSREDETLKIPLNSQPCSTFEENSHNDADVSGIDKIVSDPQSSENLQILQFTQSSTEDVNNLLSAQSCTQNSHNFQATQSSAKDIQNLQFTQSSRVDYDMISNKYDDADPYKIDKSIQSSSQSSVTDSAAVVNSPSEKISTDIVIDEFQQRKKKTRTIEFNICSIKKDLEVRRKRKTDEAACYRKFRSKISPGENVSAEEELKKEIKKENFLQMEIIGQFNLGFIITRLMDDLFIIDQHATDEKYNFEILQKQTVLETQKLINPQTMNLTAVSEAILIDNVNIFEKSGFKFNINEENPVGCKVQLISVPVSHTWRFGKEDIDEMIFMLTDNPVSMVRPSRINQMFASRACRKSVMIGTALTLPMMKKLVHHMGEIEQPWNCPHGRPTLRHLFNLNLLKPI